MEHGLHLDPKKNIKNITPAFVVLISDSLWFFLMHISTMIIFVQVAEFVAKATSTPCWKVAYNAHKNAEFVFQNQIKLRLESE